MVGAATQTTYSTDGTLQHAGATKEVGDDYNKLQCTIPRVWDGQLISLIIGKRRCIGIAVARPASEQFEVAFTTGAVVNGADQSNLAAELDAVHTLVLAAYVAKVRVYVFIDNKDVQVTFKMLNQGELIVPRYGFQRWLDLKAHVQHDMKHDCEWIPSHDKRPDWTPLHSIITAQQARKLNAAADEQATGFSNKQKRILGIDNYEQRLQRAHTWSANACNRLVTSHKAWLASHPVTSHFVERWYHAFHQRATASLQ